MRPQSRADFRKFTIQFTAEIAGGRIEADGNGPAVAARQYRGAIGNITNAALTQLDLNIVVGSQSSERQLRSLTYPVDQCAAIGLCPNFDSAIRCPDFVAQCFHQHRRLRFDQVDGGYKAFAVSKFEPVGGVFFPDFQYAGQRAATREFADDIASDRARLVTDIDLSHGKHLRGCDRCRRFRSGIDIIAIAASYIIGHEQKEVQQRDQQQKRSGCANDQPVSFLSVVFGSSWQFGISIRCFD